METPFLIADAAEVAIMSPLAEAAFGSYDLQVPEGIDIEDIHDFEAPGNELGYVARLSPQRATGIARRFIRADVAVNAKDDTDPDVIPESDVDRVLSEAESRVESEFFLESDITKAGLGSWVPYVDFNVGDIVNVRIFDIWVSLPVTRIEPIISDGDIVDWRVHVGGQLLSDDQAREVENATIQKELIQDRRDLAGIDAKATKAVKDSSEAKSTADTAKETADDALEAARNSVSSGREFLESMHRHVALGVQQTQQAQQLATQAGEFALRAEEVLAGLDPLRDDVVRAHEQVRNLGRQAAVLATQAAQHVTDGAAHVVNAKAAANLADEYATAALGLVDEADDILAQTKTARDDADAALSNARGLLDNVPGDGRSLVEILAEVVTLHQDALEAHDIILDAHDDVLAKHGEAIRYTAMAAQQAGVAAAQAAMAADEALHAADLNAQAIIKLAKADEKLILADEYLQDQIDILEESQRNLIKATKLLAAATMANSQATHSALMAAQDAGAAAGAALDAAEDLADVVEAREETIEAWRATQDIIDAEQTELIDQIKAQQIDIVRMQNEGVNVIMATSAGTSFPGVDTAPSTDGFDWEFTIPDTRGALVKIEFWDMSQIPATHVSTQIGSVTSLGQRIRTTSEMFVQVTWAKPKAVQRTINAVRTENFTPVASDWVVVSALTTVAGNNATQGFLTAKVIWSAASRGQTYGIQFRINGVVVDEIQSTKVGPLSFIGQGRVAQKLSLSDVSIPAGQSVQVAVYASGGAAVREVDEVSLVGAWIETQ